MPVGSPAASFTIAPPSGAGVSRVMPASASATRVRQPPCARRAAARRPGCRAWRRRSSARVGSVWSGHDSWSQKPPRIQRPFGCSSANVRDQRGRLSAATSRRADRPRSAPSRRRSRCTCASLKPGTTEPTAARSTDAWRSVRHRLDLGGRSRRARSARRRPRPPRPRGATRSHGEDAAVDGDQGRHCATAAASRRRYDQDGRDVSIEAT